MINDNSKSKEKMHYGISPVSAFFIEGYIFTFFPAVSLNLYLFHMYSLV